MREAAVTKGQIADIYQARGELDAALEIREKEQLPVYEKLGDVRELLVVRTKIALGLIQRNQAKEDGQAIVEHLGWTYIQARARGYKEEGQIEQILIQIGIGKEQLEMWWEQAQSDSVS